MHSLNIVIYPIALYHAILDITSVFFFNSIITKLLDNNIRTYKNEKTIGLKMQNQSDWIIIIIPCAKDTLKRENIYDKIKTNIEYEAVPPDSGAE